MTSREGAGPAGSLRRGPAHGFTLIELLVTLALTSIVLVAVFAAMESQTRSQAVSEQSADIHQNLRVGVETVVRDIRLAGLRTVGQPSIAQAGPFQLALYADVNGSCLCDAGEVREGEDVCWGYYTTLDSTSSPPPAPPASCPSLDNTAVPYGDSPNGISFYTDGTIPSDPTNAPSHAELIFWTFDSPSPNDDALPLADNAFATADELLVPVSSGGNCPTPGINGSDVDATLGAGGNELMNLYRIEVTNDTTLDSTGNTVTRARVAKGLVGPCTASGAIRHPVDEIGRPWPAFAYWIDLTEDKTITTDCLAPRAADEDMLWGDTNGDCQFSVAEFDLLGAVPRVNTATPRAVLDNIVRVDVHLVAESSERARAGATVGGATITHRGRYLASGAFVRSER